MDDLYHHRLDILYHCVGFGGWEAGAHVDGNRRRGGRTDRVGFSNLFCFLGENIWIDCFCVCVIQDLYGAKSICRSVRIQDQ